jgi:hypothetical protein
MDLTPFEYTQLLGPDAKITDRDRPFLVIPPKLHIRRNAVATGSSIVGIWNTFVDWGSTGNPVFANPFTIDANGTWTYPFGGGRWIQMEGMAFFNFDNAAGLVYTANVTLDTLCGVMGYALSPPNPGSGVWWGTRPGAPQLAAERVAAMEESVHDYLLAPRE